MENGAALELVDPSLGDSYSRNEITRCLHIALLCVQEDPNDRPTLTSVVLMLTSFSISLPLPREPSSFEQSMTIVARRKTPRAASPSWRWRFFSLLLELILLGVAT